MSKHAKKVAHQAARPPDQTADEGRSLAFERIVFFSDAVFAIAVTLLAVDIRLPEIIGNSIGADAVDALLHDFLPRVGFYMLSFVVIASYWMAHHRHFRYIRRYDQRLMMLNVLFLLCVAFIPVPTNGLGAYGNETFAVVIYALTVGLSSLFQTVMWWHATHNHHLVDADLPRDVIRYNMARTAVTTAYFFVTAGLAFFVAPIVIELGWIGVFIAMRVIVTLNRGRLDEED
jgi:uncharacterized membrane protein